jgi:hypothetical protein
VEVRVCQKARHVSVIITVRVVNTHLPKHKNIDRGGAFCQHQDRFDWVEPARIEVCLHQHVKIDRTSKAALPITKK